MTTSWDLFAEQEAGLTAEDMADWRGDQFSSGDLAAQYAFAPAPESLGYFLNPEGQLYNDGLLAQTYANYNLSDNTADHPSGWNTEQLIALQGMGTDADSFSLTESVSEGLGTVHSFFKQIFGDDGAKMLYAGAISAAASALLKNMTGSNQYKDLARLQDDKQEHEKELLTMKYARDDLERERRSAVPKRSTKINYNPMLTSTYKVPGTANNIQYGLLTGAK